MTTDHTPPADQTAIPPLTEVWVVWREDEPAYGYFTTEDAAKQATIGCWEEDEPTCPDYSWRHDGPRWELVVGGEHGGVYASRHRVYGAPVPPRADRAAAWLDAASECNKAGGAYAERGSNDAAGAAFALMEKFLMEAGKAEYVATPCSAPDYCEDGGEPCSVHERLMGHAEGDHELCAPDCGEPWMRRMADETQPAEAHACGNCEGVDPGSCLMNPDRPAAERQDGAPS